MQSFSRQTRPCFFSGNPYEKVFFFTGRENIYFPGLQNPISFSEAEADLFSFGERDQSESLKGIYTYEKIYIFTYLSWKPSTTVRLDFLSVFRFLFSSWRKTVLKLFLSLCRFALEKMKIWTLLRKSRLEEIVWGFRLRCTHT